jgi:hypothetical protein
MKKTGEISAELAQRYPTRFAHLVPCRTLLLVVTAWLTCPEAWLGRSHSAFSRPLVPARRTGSLQSEVGLA